ncbi:MAG: phosphoenolpyruvate--protein phosphotransferase [Spirochaetes bacterium]|nr:phosphoenolpyruvate--protein phosphotransferase [Spirochaetota bacterium]
MQTDHVKMLYDIGELNNLFSESISIESFLEKIVETVAEHMDAEVCSIYLYDDTTEELVLKATKGLKQDSVNKVKLKLGEGLVGLCMKDLTPVCEKCGNDNPSFKFYPGINEENYDSFLATPIARGNIRIGVLVVQREKGRIFHEKEVIAIRATASQLASMIENIKYIISPQIASQVKDNVDILETIKFIRGKSASRGYIYNEVIQIDNDHPSELIEKPVFKDKYTLDDFNRALGETEDQLEHLQKNVEEKLSDAASLIFSAHLLILKDVSFTGRMRELIAKGKNPPTAVIEVYKKYREIFLHSQSDIIREKIHDITDLVKRILENLVHTGSFRKQLAGKIVAAREIYPSDLLAMSAENIGGIILVSGGVTSHVSILSRSLKIPAVIANVPELLLLPDKTMAIVDADQGNIYINPAKEVVSKFDERNKAAKKIIFEDKLLKMPTVTSDGTAVKLMVNINLLNDVQNIANIENDGIGLYRTEFPFIIRNNFPGEEEQYTVYSRLVQSMGEKTVVFRTLDIGGDKVLSYYQGAKEENPFLGMRSIRFSLTHKDIFKQQLRAILRAGYNKNIKIMFPMISSLDEFISSKDIIRECIVELKNESIQHNDSPEIGMMVEIPSVINIIDDFAGHADFFSIGTNDLIQYTLAVDRTNENVSELYLPHHPAILRSLKIIAVAGITHGIDVSVCGDMAGDEKYIPFLIGIGIRSLSVDSGYLPAVKKIILNISISQAEKIAEEMLSKDRIAEINKIIHKIGIR